MQLMLFWVTGGGGTAQKTFWEVQNQGEPGPSLNRSKVGTEQLQVDVQTGVFNFRRH